MPKRSRCTENPMAQITQLKLSLLEEIPCLESVLIFLTKKDVCSLFYCKKIFQFECFQDMCQKHQWNMSQKQTIDVPNLNLNWIKSVAICFNEKNESTIMEFISKLKCIEKIDTSAEMSHTIKIESLPETITKWKCRGYNNKPYALVTLLPSKLKWFFNKVIMETRFPLLKLEPGIFPNSLTSLTFRCNQKLMNGILPESLYYLDINCTEEILKVGFIPQSVRYLYFTSTATMTIHNNSLPKKLIDLKMIAGNNSIFSTNFILPETILKIRLSYTFEQGFATLPPKLQHLTYFDSVLFFAKLKNRTFPDTLTSLEYFNQFNLPTVLPLDMAFNLKQLVSLKCYNIHPIAIEYFNCEKLISLYIRYCKQNISLSRLQGLVTLSIGFDPNVVVSIHGLVSLTNLKKLEIVCSLRKSVNNIIVGKYPKNIIDLTLIKMQNVSYLKKLVTLKLKTNNKIEISDVSYFPKNLVNLIIDAKTIIWPQQNNNSSIFPKSLYTLSLQCDFQRRKPFLQESQLLTELSLSACFLNFNLFQLIPQTVLKLYLPFPMKEINHLDKFNNAIVVLSTKCKY